MKQIHMNALYLILRSLNFVKNKGRMDENMMFENTETMTSSGKLPSRRELRIKSQLEEVWSRNS